jgi:hypothetical protein
MEIRTERLLLRRPHMDDLDAMFEIMSNPLAMRYWSTLPHASRDVTRPWLAQMIARTAAGGEDFLVEHDGRVIGNVGAGRLPDFGFIIHPDSGTGASPPRRLPPSSTTPCATQRLPNCAPMWIPATWPRYACSHVWGSLKLVGPRAPSCWAMSGATASIFRCNAPWRPPRLEL